MPRILHYFPIVHTSADFGALGESVRQAKAAVIGRRAVLRDAARIDQFWREVEIAAGRVPAAAGRLRVYQDSLPVCDHVQQIVQDLARAGSTNHRILLKLQARGAVLMGSEDAGLLLEEYGLAKAGLSMKHAGRAGGAPPGGMPEAGSLLNRRDRFIASRINATLEPEEAGIVFIGALHAISRHLNSDIQVIYPLYRPVGADFPERGPK